MLITARILVFIYTTLVIPHLVQTQTIRLRQGFVQGMVVESVNRQILAFLGVPYAKPPIGSRRFKPPQSHDGWDGTLSAFDFGPACPQPFRPGLAISEDCLTLNIWAPIAERYRRFPVIVALEGELFLTSDPSRFPGQDLAIYDTVVVTVNYRVNAFGFLSWEDEVLPGNLGLMDQSLALRWIIENIEYFGGDVSSITLLGHSSGGASAAFLMASEYNRGLFQRVIILSGSSLSPWATTLHSKKATATLALNLNCEFDQSHENVSTSLLECLQHSDISIMHILNEVEKMVESGNPHHLFAPVYDGHIEEHRRLVGERGPRTLLENIPSDIPVLVCASREDGSVILSIKREINYMSYSYLRRYGKEVLVPLVTSLSIQDPPASSVLNYLTDYIYLQKAEAGNKDDLVKFTVEMFTDSFFVAPIISMTEILSRRGVDLYFLIDDFQSTDIYKAASNITGALHGSIMALLFGPTAYTSIFKRPMNFNEAKVSETLKKMIYSYINRGEPSLGVSFPPPPSWEKYTVRRPVYAHLSTGRLKNEFEAHRLTFWNHLLPGLSSLLSIYVSPNGYPTSPPITSIQTLPTNVPVVSTAAPSKDEEEYEAYIWVLVALIILLAMAVLAFVVFSRRRKRLASTSLGNS